jgi:hypothetical protein
MKITVLAVCLTFASAGMAQSSAPTAPDKSSPPMQQDSQPASLAHSLNKGEQKITGCIRADNGKFSLESKQHKKVWLSGAEDFAPHAGHSVVVYGKFVNNSDSPNGSAPAAEGKTSAREGSNFEVTKMEMVSENCTLKQPKKN